MKKESLERRLYDILKDGFFHSSYDLTEKLNGANRPLFRLSGRISDLRARGCEIECYSEKEYHKYLLFTESMTGKMIGNMPKRVWYRMVYVPADIFDISPSWKHKDKTELWTTFGDGTRVCLV